MILLFPTFLFLHIVFQIIAGNVFHLKCSLLIVSFGYTNISNSLCCSPPVLFFPATLESLWALNRFRVPATTPVGVGHAVCLVYSTTKKDDETTSMQTLTYT